MSDHLLIHTFFLTRTHNDVSGIMHFYIFSKVSLFLLSKTFPFVVGFLYWFWFFHNKFMKTTVTMYVCMCI